MSYTNSTPKYQHVKVNAVAEDGNAFAIIGKVKGKPSGRLAYPNPIITEFIRQATKGGYNHLLQTVMEWVNVE